MFVNIHSTEYCFHLDDNTFIGGCRIFPSKHLENAVELWCFGIMGKYRGKGYGQQALNEIIQHNLNQTIVLFVEKTNARALHIYEKAGFQIVGEYRGGSYAWEMRLCADTSVRFD